MKKPEIEVREIKIAELRKTLRVVLESKHPAVVQRNSRAIAILLSVETGWFGRLEHPLLQKRRLLLELDAALRKLSRTFSIL
jgi:hypothetical protein